MVLHSLYSRTDDSEGNSIKQHIFRSKLLEDFKIMVLFVRRAAFKSVNGFGRSATIMVAVFFARAIIGGNVVPQAVSNIVNALKDEEMDVLVYGLGLFGVSAVVYAVTEFVLFRYFRKLAEIIVALKKLMIGKIMSGGTIDAPEDVIGRVSSDIDFVVWNMNATLVTLIPNIFTGVVATYTIFSFNMQVGAVTLCTLLPYLLLAEYYSRRAEIARLEERHEYSVSIAYIRDIVYWRQENGFLDKVLEKWYRAILRVMWYDRVYWGVSLFTQFASIGLVSFVALSQARSGFINAGSLAGILSAAISAHTALLNAMWALCIQGQNIAAIKRIIAYFYDGRQGYEGKSAAYPTAPTISRIQG